MKNKELEKTYKRMLKEYDKANNSNLVDVLSIDTLVNLDDTHVMFKSKRFLHIITIIHIKNNKIVNTYTRTLTANIKPTNIKNTWIMEYLDYYTKTNQLFDIEKMIEASPVVTEINNFDYQNENGSPLALFIDQIANNYYPRSCITTITGFIKPNGKIISPIYDTIANQYYNIDDASDNNITYQSIRENISKAMQLNSENATNNLCKKARIRRK